MDRIELAREMKRGGDWLIADGMYPWVLESFDGKYKAEICESGYIRYMASGFRGSFLLSDENPMQNMISPDRAWAIFTLMKGEGE